jgi:CheY-like chemotaxis protein
MFFQEIPMTQTVLLVTSIAGAENCASAIGRQLGLAVELAQNRRAALAALRRREYSVMVLDEGLIEADPAGAEVLWQQAGLAIPVQVNLGISGCNRVLREVRAALQRRERELSLAMRAATQLMEGEMNTTITGLLLQTQLALAEPALPANLAAKLQQVVNLAGTLRDQLRHPPEAAS